MATAPRLGLSPCKSVGSGADNKGLTEYTIANAYATALGTGDLVQLTGTSNNIQVGANTSQNLGVFHSCYYVDSTGRAQFQKYWPASTSSLVTPVTALVMDSPAATYNMVATSPLTLAVPGAWYAINLSAPNSSTGRSTMTINNTPTSTGTVVLGGLTNTAAATTNGAIFTVKSSVANVLTTVTFATNQTSAQLLALINVAGNGLIGSFNAGNFLVVATTDGGELVIADSTDTPVATYGVLAATGTINSIVADSAGAVEIVKVIDTVNNVAEVRLTNANFRSNLSA
jgi:hypothetical protein